MNPFDDPDVATRYEAWYLGPGVSADRLEKTVLEELLPDGRTLLEVGCGTGHFTRWFEERGLSTVGLDASAAMLAEARLEGSKLLVRADAGALPFPAGSFDIVALITALEFVPDPERALAEAVRVARRGLVVGTLNRFGLYGVRRRLEASPLWRRARWLGPHDVRKLLRRAAGSRARGLEWCSVSWTLPLCGVPRRFPFGDFVGFAVKLTTA